MTVFAACLFAMAALVAAQIIASSWLRHAGAARMLSKQLRACTDSMTLDWKAAERVPMPALSMLRKDRLLRSRRHLQWNVTQGNTAWNVAERPGLEWPERGAEIAA